MRELEEENAKLKAMYAEMSLENRALKGLIEKRLVTPLRREAVGYLKTEHELSERRALKRC
ncbi:MAG: hypothetical protein IPN51_10625 [Chloracidobacterium sp.]|nr:hypothetical protein [Chloracidobacterium sp.]